MFSVRFAVNITWRGGPKRARKGQNLSNFQEKQAREGPSGRTKKKAHRRPGNSPFSPPDPQTGPFPPRHPAAQGHRGRPHRRATRTSPTTTQTPRDPPGAPERCRARGRGEALTRVQGHPQHQLAPVVEGEEAAGQEALRLLVAVREEPVAEVVAAILLLLPPLSRLPLSRRLPSSLHGARRRRTRKGRGRWPIAAPASPLRQRRGRGRPGPEEPRSGGGRTKRGRVAFWEEARPNGPRRRRRAAGAGAGKAAAGPGSCGRRDPGGVWLHRGPGIPATRDPGGVRCPAGPGARLPVAQQAPPQAPEGVKAWFVTRGGGGEGDCSVV